VQANCTDSALPMVGSIRGFASLSKKKKKILTSQHTSLLTERSCFQKLVGDEIKTFLMMLQKWLTLSNRDQFTQECLKETV
jgi:hypothetical protein